MQDEIFHVGMIHIYVVKVTSHLLICLMAKFEEIQSAGQQIQTRYFNFLNAYFTLKYIKLNPMLKRWSSYLKSCKYCHWAPLVRPTKKVNFIGGSTGAALIHDLTDPEFKNMFMR